MEALFDKFRADVSPVLTAAPDTEQDAHRDAQYLGVIVGFGQQIHAMADRLADLLRIQARRDPAHHDDLAPVGAIAALIVAQVLGKGYEVDTDTLLALQHGHPFQYLVPIGRADMAPG